MLAKLRTFDLLTGFTSKGRTATPEPITTITASPLPGEIQTP
jgi:hypothetical protein